MPGVRQNAERSTVTVDTPVRPPVQDNAKPVLDWFQLMYSCSLMPRAITMEITQKASKGKLFKC